VDGLSLESWKALKELLDNYTIQATASVTSSEMTNMVGIMQCELAGYELDFL